jgi:hypothetical protein
VTDDNILAERYAHLSLKGAVARYAGTAVVLVAAAANLPGLAVQFAEATGLAQGFVGTAFVALSTSLPELARQRDFSTGTLGLWSSNHFVVYYSSGSVPAPGIIILGQVTGDVSIFDRPGNVTVDLTRLD